MRHEFVRRQCLAIAACRQGRRLSPTVVTTHLSKRPTAIFYKEFQIASIADETPSVRGVYLYGSHAGNTTPIAS
jgi:hypothetical protein